MISCQTRWPLNPLFWQVDMRSEVNWQTLVLSVNFSLLTSGHEISRQLADIGFQRAGAPWSHTSLLQTGYCSVCITIYRHTASNRLSDTGHQWASSMTTRHHYTGRTIDSLYFQTNWHEASNCLVDIDLQWPVASLSHVILILTVW